MSKKSSIKSSGYDLKSEFIIVWLIEGNGFETRQSSLLYVIVLFLGLDSAQNTIVVYSVLRN